MLPAGLFETEARSLAALAGTTALRVPRVVAVHDSAAESGGERWLLLEWLEPGHAERATWAQLGTGLAQLHRTRDERAGWPHDNFIGALPQDNQPLGDWAAFWRARRLEPQLRRAYDDGAFDQSEARRFDALLAALDGLLAAAAEDGHSLLHGDLWSGNLHVLRGGVPALIDPASYHGHREVDLAMTRLFGGFDDGFYDAYTEAWPLQPGHAARLPIYQLYYLLVHVNLFGASYRSNTLAALRSAGF
jgi:fructosamine-3-kinase